MTSFIPSFNSIINMKNETFQPNLSHINMKTVASIILGGGQGLRLHPLTLKRCKPAVPFGGSFRLIDVPIAHSIHSGCSKIFVLTQFLSSSLHHHLFQTYHQNGSFAGLIEVLTAEQKPLKQNWFQGTADAVRQNIEYILETPAEYFLILSGDQLYDMDVRHLVDVAKKTDADIVIAALPVKAQRAGQLGILKVNSDGFVVDFHEKPQDKSLLKQLKVSAQTLKNAGLSPTIQQQYLGSMGIYLFKRKALVRLLQHDLREDFGKHLIPTCVKEGKVAAYLYNGYWEDIGTIGTFYQANLALTEENPVFDLYNKINCLFTSQTYLPPAKIFGTNVKQALVCEGAIIEANEVTHSILGPRTVIKKGSIIRDSYLMGNDYYHSPMDDYPLPATPQVGSDCVIKKTIIDKNVQIGNRVKLINKKKLNNYQSDNLYIRDGIIIVPRGAVIPDGFVL